ncbi:PRD domain-containing protein [Enterococcus hulanensis]|uniref:PRD domain-containing protein n=1 Tax=Enterococcus hulanensis TaxID=2559929 RepID=UPI001A8C67B5|nr:PRD domain-containing protein [Enterococcus hulanensis]MBO0458138.1 PRD domain-containing protein [Enterococcus hulanensis]
MQVIKHINNNAAIGIDSKGNEVVILGTGVGFKKIPYELADLSKIERTFYDVDYKYMEMLTTIPQSIILASADIIEQAEINMDSEFNPNIAFTLADHINFAIERMNQDIDITVPLVYDVKHMYPEEYELGVLALDIVKDYVDIQLPESEKVNIALHLITGQVGRGDMHSAMITMKVVTEVSNIIESELNIHIDEDSYNYSRLVTHLRHLVHRLEKHNRNKSNSNHMLYSLKQEYPEVYICAKKVADYFLETRNWECGEDELLYLVIHINRVKQKNE